MPRRHGQSSFFIVGEGVIAESSAEARAAQLPTMASAAEETSRALRFSRMFGKSAVPAPDPSKLKTLAEQMIGNSADSTIPAGFTYLGQFIDHDITANNQGVISTTELSIEELIQERTPSLDLDSLYGRGPRQEADMYTNDGDGQRTLFQIGATVDVLGQGDPKAGQAPLNDLPRKAGSAEAIIGDERNDENLIVAQTHLAFLKFHNKVVQTMHSPAHGLIGAELFEAARRKVTLHYQWIVLHDFVQRIVDPAVLQAVLALPKEERLYQVTPGTEPTMPIEFSVAAYRLGHSMVREEYDYNRIFPNGSASLPLLFEFTGLSGELGVRIGAPGADGEHLPNNWIIDWNRFYDFDNRPASNRATQIDTHLTDTLKNLPGGIFFVGPEDAQQTFGSASLAARNLLRGRLVTLPTGQEVAAQLGIAPLAITFDDPELKEFETQTPLWFYLLKEAEVEGAGQRLGPIGSRIVAETFVGLIENSRTSIFPLGSWQPNLPSRQPGEFSMADLLRFVDDLNPLGDEN
jgi:hypothetical protein